LLSGTTWVSELVWLVMNNCDAEKAAATPLYARTSMIEGFSMIQVKRVTGKIISVQS
jgi:hypothetical protein